MNKNLIFLSCVFFIACSNQPTLLESADYIRETGQGSTFEEAKQNAFIKAIQFQVGVLISTAREVVQDQLTKDEILAYSAGYVDDFRIISEQTATGVTTVIVDVKVASSKLSKRLLGGGISAGAVEGERHATQYTSYLDNKFKGDALLSSILDDYPQRAYYIKQKPHTFKVDAYRNAVLSIPFEMGWNYNYIISLNEALGLVQDRVDGFMQAYPGTVVVMAKDPENSFLGRKDVFRFFDLVLIDKIGNSLIENRPAIRVEIKDIYNTTILSECRDPDALTAYTPPLRLGFFRDNNARRDSYWGSDFVNNHRSSIIIRGNTKDFNAIDISVQSNSPLGNALRNVSRIDVAVVSRRSC